MKKIFFTVFCFTTILFSVNFIWADVLSDRVSVSVTVQRVPDGVWGIEIKDGDSNVPGNDISCIDTSGVQMYAMSQRRLVLGKVYLKLQVCDLYKVVVYTNAMDTDNDGIPNLPWDWSYKNERQKDDFIARHAGLQNQNPEYIDHDGFNSLLYGAALKIRSEGFHGDSSADGPISYDSDGDGYQDSTTALMINQTVPDQLWDAFTYPELVQFFYIPELANETIIGMDVLPVAGSIYQSPLKNVDGTENWLEMVLATSEENIGSGLHTAEIYFDLRWN